MMKNPSTTNPSNLNSSFTSSEGAALVRRFLKEDFFQTFIPNKKISDAKTQTEVLIALSSDSKEQVNEQLQKALDAGATEARAAEDHGFMYSRSFEDPDGHIWEIFWMDPAAINSGQ